MSKATRAALVGALFGFIAGLLLYQIHRAGSELNGIYAMLAGMSAMGSLSAFVRYSEVPPPNITIQFDPDFMATAIIDAMKGRPLAFAEDSPYEVSAARLVGADNSLALAKLRIDIERELRILVDKMDHRLPQRSLGAMFIAKDLARVGLLPETLLYPLREVVSVCNQAVHGQFISNEKASEVISVGETLVRALRTIANDYPRRSRAL